MTRREHAEDVPLNDASVARPSALAPPNSTAVPASPVIGGSESDDYSTAASSGKGAGSGGKTKSTIME